MTPGILTVMFSLAVTEGGRPGQLEMTPPRLISAFDVGPEASWVFVKVLTFNLLEVCLFSLP